MKFIHIFKDGKMDEIIYNMKKKNEKELLRYLLKISKSQGSNNLKKLYTWDYYNSKIVSYSWYDGEHGFENKHQLPQSGISDFIDEDSSIKKIYGDIFIIKDDYSDINISEYSVFYSGMLKDYSDYDTDSVSSAENNLEDYLIENKIINDPDIDYDNDNNNDNDNCELEYDNYDY